MKNAWSKSHVSTGNTDNNANILERTWNNGVVEEVEVEIQVKKSLKK